MAYKELIKNLKNIRLFIKQFYIYGFKSRDQYHFKSSRSYDNEKRRIENYLSDYMGFYQNKNGKNVFLSIDSSSISHNPLYQPFTAKSFTNIDISLHFIILDILYDENTKLSVKEILNIIDNDYLCYFNSPIIFDESTLRKKLNEYVKLGILSSYKERIVYYYRNAVIDLKDYLDAIHFFSEYSLLGVVGYYLNHDPQDIFRFKHHYITHALDSEILYEILKAIHAQKYISVEYPNRTIEHVIPLKILVSTQNGRRYFIGYVHQRYQTFRIDHIIKITITKEVAQTQEYQTILKDKLKNLWGSAYIKEKTEHIEMVIYFDEHEEYIYKRILKEKRCGHVKKIDKNHCLFQADVYDSAELVPWIRSFIGRITSISFSNKEIEKQFNSDLEKMYELYEVNDYAVS